MTKSHSDLSSASDEPSRIDAITNTLFGNQSGMWRLELAGEDRGAEISLLLGADGRDDCAIYGIRGDVDMVIGTDYVRGPKFTMYELGLLSVYDLGYYLVMANLSDIAGMRCAKCRRRYRVCRASNSLWKRNRILFARPMSHQSACCPRRCCLS
jgi:hypothetical protein